MDDLRCKVCEKSDKLVLVAQLYAPTDLFQRSLYIFCCNKRECSLKSDGWIALRNQIRLGHLPTYTATSEEHLSASHANPDITCKQSVWDFLSDETHGENTTLGTDDKDLIALLETRDMNLASKSRIQEKAAKVKHSKIETVGAQKILKLRTTIPLCKLKEVVEEWDTSLDDEEEVILSDGADRDHINKLIATYLQDEDDEENMSMLRACGIGNNEETILSLDNIACFDEDEEENEDSDDRPKILSEVKKAEIELYFQKRVSLHPKQVVRYAYDGIPMWITAPDPMKDGINKVCPLCGVTRVFECQLMPTLLSYISQHSLKIENAPPIPSSKSGNYTITASTIMPSSDILGEEMDFGVVTVWCCPNSCEFQDSSCSHELVIVQPPPDIV